MSKVKNWRRRAEDEEEEAEEEPAKVVQQPSAIKARKEVKKAVAPVVKPSGPKLLSFAGDEEDGEGDGGSGRRAAGLAQKAKKEKKPQLKQGGAGVFRFGEEKPDGDLVLLQSGGKEKRKGGFGVGHSGYKIELGKEKEKLKLPSNVQAQVGEYTKEKLLELQRNTKMVGAAKPVVDSMPAEPVVVLKGLLKPVEEPKGVAEVKVGGVFVESELQEGVRKVEETTTRVEYDAERRLGLMGIGTGADSGGVTHIPDAAMIAAAKARRNRLRQAQAAPDYIPVNDGDVRGGGRERAEGEGGKEDAESSEDEAEVHGRMSFLGDTIGGKHKSKGAVFEAMAKEVELAHQEDDEADEERTWEEEQLRKGFGKRVEDVSRVMSGAGPTVGHGGFPPGLPAVNAGNFGYAYGRGPAEVMSISQQAEGAWRSLQDNINKMRVLYLLSSLFNLNFQLLKVYYGANHCLCFPYFLCTC
jgi:GC-rich sequence DNA-binding factor